MRFRLPKCCFCNGSKFEKAFKKMKWHVKIHGKMPFDSREKGTDIFRTLGVPLYALDLQNTAFAREAKLKKI